MTPGDIRCKSHSWGDGIVIQDTVTNRDELIFECRKCGVKRITSYDETNGTFSTRLVGGEKT